MHATPHPASDDDAIRAVSLELARSWNRRDAAGFAACFTEDGSVVGYDGEVVEGRERIAVQLSGIFARHETPVYVTTVQRVCRINNEVAALRSIGGMFSVADTTLNPTLNAFQTLIMRKRDGVWRIVLAQTTPAKLDGQPELARRITEELQRELDNQ
ncbi:MAG TPA: SgcJ/EcaC family oxidoreductase [Ktedonobacterales bacterium]|nr:SgcJ/EcaC family oxidoreductase [Ktedonobacterales bacterium]